MVSDPEKALAIFLRDYVSDPQAIDAFISVIRDVFTRSPVSRTPRRDLAERIERLAQIAGPAARSLELVLLQNADACRRLSEELIFQLRYSELLSKQEDRFDPEFVRFARKEMLFFDKKTKFLFRHLNEFVEGLDEIGKAARRFAVSRDTPLRREGKPPNEARRAIGIELAGLWVLLTGERPTVSGSASVENPGSPFGRFVVLAANLTPEGHVVTNGDLRHFLRQAVAHWKEKRERQIPAKTMGKTAR